MKPNKNNKWSFGLKMLGVIILVLFIAVGGYAFYVYNSLSQAVDTMQEPIEREKSEKRPEPVTLEQKQPFSVLLLGVDEREGDRGRSDTMIVVTVNPDTKTTKMLSIPRDTRTEIIGKDFEDKINHAYAFGGVEMSMDTVENFLDIPIDYYMKINMEGFKDIVEAVDGITVQNDLDFTYEGDYFPKGDIHLNADEALNYSRMRYEDPRGDFGRQSRQREIIKGVIKKGASFSSLTRFDEIFDALGKNIKTNIKFDEMVDIQTNYKESAESIQQLEISGKGAKIDGIYYFIVADEEKQKLQQTLKEHLELK
ncbi:LytR family transcriptional regulator [Bacillus sp. ISL-41]|uniref:polyisoprenyl-teichoic acid--peptidoglycan teichoic acid transferase TagU n=1 Tax=Bacillus sp. ISL-41 TaxID=2819127 RepID=UPI001BE6F42F|nr:LytR family transcriptional regulator [Bacillus sp. ISL-41]MBT2644635.1 LytR family transcriptional regulator [Bacillus sp. ISL-41]